MTLLKHLVSEAHRRSLWQVLGIYAVGAWVSYEVILGLVEGLGLPGWVPPFAVVLFLIGLPVVMATAFVQEGMGGEGAADTGGRSGSDPRSGRDSGSSGTLRDRLFTWRNAILGGVAAFALLGTVTAGYLLMWTTGVGPLGSLVAQGVLEERDAVVLAEFDNATSDALLGDVVTEALRVDLLESQVITVVDPTYVQDVLRRMERDTSERLTAEVAREVALREGIKAVVSGDVGALGDGYVLTARISASEDGRSLAAFRETARNEGELIGAVDQLSQRIRERAGESLRQIRAGQPLSAVTTSSLEGLRRYTAALRADEAGNTERAIGLLEEAVEIDPDFAMAYRKLAATWSNRGHRRLMREYGTRAYELRGRLTVRERYLAEALYHQMVGGDRERARRAYESVLELHPDDRVALNNLGLLLGEQGDLEGAEELYLRAVSGTGRTLTAQGNLVGVRLGRGELEGAREALAMLGERYPETPTFYSLAVAVAAVEGRYPAADSILTEMETRLPDRRDHLVLAAVWRGYLRAIEGRLGEARRLFIEGEARAEAAGIRPLLNEGALSRASLELFVAEDPGRALAVLEDHLSRHPLEEMDPGIRPTTWLAFLYAQAGRPDRAEAFLGIEEQEDAGGRPGEEVARRLARAAVASARGDAATALRTIRETRRLPGCAVPSCGLVDLALIHDRAGASDSAAVHYAAYLETPDSDRFGDTFWAIGPKVLERLGEIHEELGDRQRAAEYYARFAEMWADADPELQPRVQRARERAAALAGSPTSREPRASR